MMEQVGPLLLALISFLLWMLPLTDSQASSHASHPPAPKLSVLPLSQTFTRGQQISLHCSPPEGRRPEQFLYYKITENHKWSQQNTLRGKTVHLSTTDLEQKETFVCAYWENQDGIWVQSQQSNQAEFSVFDPPATLSVDPRHPVYIQGERVTLLCLAPGGLKVTRYTFYKVQGDQSFEKVFGQQAGPSAQFHVEDETAGMYSCEYRMHLSGRETRSHQSNLVSVNMISRPRPPSFSITPKHSVYKTGESIVLSCSVPSRNGSKTLFFKDGKQVQEQLSPTSALGTTFIYPLLLLPQDGGAYSCRYQIQEATWDVSSLDSRTISFQVLGPLPPPHFIVSPESAIYRTGDSISLKCSIQKQRRHELKFLFFKDGQLLAPSPSPTYSLHLSPTDSGKYLCRYQFVESGRLIQSNASSFLQVSVMASPPPTQPMFSTTVQAAQGNQTATGPDNSAGTPTASALPSTFFQTGAGVGTPTYPQDHRITSLSAVSQSSRSQDPVHTTTHLRKPPEVTDLALAASHQMGHGSTPTRAMSQGISRPSVTNSSDPRGTTQSSEYGRPTLSHLLAIGCGSGGALVLLVLLIYLFWWKPKGNSRISARGYWKSMELQQSTRMRCKDPIGIAITLQESHIPGGQDWGLLPKSKTQTSNLGDPSKLKKRDEDADSGAEFEFPEIDPTYMLLGFSCSTFREEGKEPPKEEPGVLNELLL